jgi:dihydrofolate reductase
MISIIVAIARNGAIGKNNQLLWHLSADLVRFKKLTSGHPVILGKRTWETLPKRPLPNRRNIVISDIPGDRFEGAETVHSIGEALSRCKTEEENFIIGGASVYNQFLPHTDRLYLTLVHKDFEGDVHFFPLATGKWQLVTSETCPPDEKNDFSYSYLTYDRVK